MPTEWYFVSLLALVEACGISSLKPSGYLVSHIRHSLKMKWLLSFTFLLCFWLQY